MYEQVCQKPEGVCVQPPPPAQRGLTIEVIMQSFYSVADCGAHDGACPDSLSQLNLSILTTGTDYKRKPHQ